MFFIYISHVTLTLCDNWKKSYRETWQNAVFSSMYVVCSFVSSWNFGTYDDGIQRFSLL